MKTRVTRAAVAVATVITAVLGLGLATAGPAAAVESGTWYPYGNENPIKPGPTWNCAGTRTVTTNVYAQVCAIRSQGRGHVQGAVIVRNNRSTAYSMTAFVDVVTEFDVVRGQWACSSSGVAPASWSVCFGRTLPESSRVNSEGSANGIYLGVSPMA